MKKLVLILLSLLQLVWAEPSVLTDTAPAQQEADGTPPADATEQNGIDTLFSNVPDNSTGVILEHSNIPAHFYIGEIFPLTVKLTPTDIASGNIEYTLQGEEGIRIFSQTPVRSVKGDAVYDTFYFLVQENAIRLPDITATVTSTGSLSNVLTGPSLNASSLNPPCNVRQRSCGFLQSY